MRPIIVLQLSKIKEDKVEASEAILIMCLFVEQVMFCAGKVESFVVILDFEASNLADFQAQVIGSVVSNLLTHFVNLLDEMYIINSTPSLELTLKWNMVKSTELINKCRISSSPDFLEDLISEEGRNSNAFAYNNSRSTGCEVRRHQEDSILLASKLSRSHHTDSST